MRTRFVGALAAVLLLAVAGSAAAAPILSEHFNNIATLPGAGWAQINNSAPAGTTGWFQGNAGVFPAYDGAADAYIAANFNNAAPGGNISNWLLTPTLSISNGDTLSFFTRTVDPASFADRLEVRLSLNGASAVVGATDSSVGDFSILLMSINPVLQADGYPSNWTRFSIGISGLGAPATGRYAFRYFVPDTATNADYIGIDNVSVEPVPEPATLTLVGLGAVALGLRRRRR